LRRRLARLQNPAAGYKNDRPPGRFDAIAGSETVSRHFAFFVLAFALLGATAPASSQETLRVGELNSYKAQPAFLDAYKKGINLAVEEINAAGGVLGKKLQVVSRDDGGNPGEAVRVAEELVTGEQLSVLCGTFLSNVGLAGPSSRARTRCFFSLPNR
jgi:branched-chain amino acid transport system substrate-binding protein